MNKAKTFTKLLSTYTLTLILPVVLVGVITLVILLGSVSQRARELNLKIVNQIVNSIDAETSYILKNSTWIIDSSITDEFISEKHGNPVDLNFYAWKIISQFQLHTKSNFVDNIAIYSIKNNAVVNDSSMYSTGEYYDRYIRPVGISPDSFEQALTSESTSFFYLINDKDKNNSGDFLFCRPITNFGKTEGLLMMIINGRQLVDAVTESERKSDYPFSVFDKHGNCFLSSGEISKDVASYGNEQKTSGIYQYENSTLLVQNSKQSGYRYMFYIANNVYTGGSSHLAIIFIGLLIIIIFISTFIARKRTEKIRNRFMDFRNENTLLSTQLAGYMKDVRKNNMIKVLQNYFDALGNPAVYNFNFSHNKSRVVLMHIISPEDYAFTTFKSNTERLDGFNNEFYEVLTKNGCMCEFAREEDDLYVYVINYHEDEDFINAKDIFSSLLNQYHIQAYTGIGNPVSDINKISQSYDDALSAMNYARIARSENPVMYDSIKSESEISRYSSDKKEKLIRAISHGTEDIINNLFCEIYEDNYQENTASLPQRLIFEIISTLYRAIEETSSNKEDKLLKFDRICKQIMKMNSIEAFEILKEVALDLAKNNRDSDKQTLLREKILNYTESMYLNQDFCLQMLADEMNMNYYNVSRLFTEYIGESFISYVTSKRLEKAKEYLSETNLSVEDIAFKVGFIRSSSFINVFKKYYGLTPGKYRQSINSNK